VADLNAPRRYTRLAMIFHWLVAFGIVCNFIIVWVVDSLPEASQRPAVNLHKSIGLTVLGLAILRVLWRYANPPPALPSAYAPWERKLAHAAHYSLYALIFLMPITGWIHDSAWKGAAANPLTIFGIPWFRLGFITSQDAANKEQIHKLFFGIHSSLGWVLLALFALHVAGVVKHQWLDRERELQRMLS
jgi:cytochrome b561